MGAHRARQWQAAVASGALLALALLAPAGAFAACHLKVAELPVHMAGTRAIAMVGINDQQVPMMVDTGAFYSFLNESTAAQLGLSAHREPGLAVTGITGRVNVRVATVDRVSLSKGTIPQVDFIVGGNEVGSGAKGVIGRNLLNMADTEYDLAHGMIRFVFPQGDCENANMAYWADDPAMVAKVDLLSDNDRTFNRQPLRAKARLNGRNLDVEFDSGATTTVTLDAAIKAGVHEKDMTPDGQMYGAGKGTARAWTASFDSFALGDERIDHSRLAVGDFDMGEAEVLLGVDFFLSHHIYVSDAQRTMYFTYNGGPVFAQNKAARPSAVAAAAADGAQALDADAYLRRGAASHARGELDAALADLDRACALAPGDAACRAERASVRQDLKQSGAALADLDAALELDPGLAAPRIQRAWLRYQADATDAALDDLAELDRTLPPQSQIRASMALLYVDMDQPARALPQLDHWIRFHPHDIGLAGAYNSRCWARVLLGVEMDKALADCDAAVGLGGDKAAYVDSRAWVRVRMNEWQQAKSDFDAALKDSPEFASSLYGRSIAQARLGNVEASKADLAAARERSAGLVQAFEKQGLKL